MIFQNWSPWQLEECFRVCVFPFWLMHLQFGNRWFSLFEVVSRLVCLQILHARELAARPCSPPRLTAVQPKTFCFCCTSGFNCCLLCVSVLLWVKVKWLAGCKVSPSAHVRKDFSTSTFTPWSLILTDSSARQHLNLRLSPLIQEIAPCLWGFGLKGPPNERFTVWR